MSRVFLIRLGPPPKLFFRAFVSFLSFIIFLQSLRVLLLCFPFFFFKGQSFYRMSCSISHLIRFMLNIFGNNILTQVNSKGHFVPSLVTKFGHL